MEWHGLKVHSILSQLKDYKGTSPYRLGPRHRRSDLHSRAAPGHLVTRNGFPKPGSDASHRPRRWSLQQRSKSRHEHPTSSFNWEPLHHLIRMGSARSTPSRNPRASTPWIRAELCCPRRSSACRLCLPYFCVG
ncbi:hypothetical protein VPH35_082469 [Triticum aestivum]